MLYPIQYLIYKEIRKTVSVCIAHAYPTQTGPVLKARSTCCKCYCTCNLCCCCCRCLYASLYCFMAYSYSFRLPNPLPLSSPHPVRFS